MTMKKRIISLFLATSMLLACPSSAVSAAELHPPTPLPAGEKLYGVDVSAYNGNIDWTALAGNDLDFVIMRGGKQPSEKEAYYEDDKFDLNYEAAHSVGLKVGVYIRCGATTWESFETSINAFLETIDGKQFDYPVYVDVEEDAQAALGKEVMTKYVLDALTMIENAGYKAGVYANLNWFTNYLDKDAIAAEGYPLWLARYTHDDTSNDYSENYCMWQYSNTGDLAGNGSSAIDLDVSYMDFNYYPENWQEVDSAYASILPLKACIRYNVNFTPSYADFETPMNDVSLPPSTECEIQEVYKNGWCRFKYQSDGVRRVGYLPIASFLEGLPSNMEERPVPAQVPTYGRFDYFQRIGNLDRYDTCRVVQERDGAVEVIYPVDGGYKLGWFRAFDWELAYLNLLQTYVLGRNSLTPAELNVVDLNRDGVVDVFDLGLMRRKVLTVQQAEKAE